MIFKRSEEKDFFWLMTKMKDGRLLPLEAVHCDTLYDFLPRWIWDLISESKPGRIVEVEVDQPDE